MIAQIETRELFPIEWARYKMVEAINQGKVIDMHIKSKK